MRTHEVAEACIERIERLAKEGCRELVIPAIEATGHEAELEVWLSEAVNILERMIMDADSDDARERPLKG